MADDERERGERARRLRAEIDRLRYSDDAEVKPKSPREFLDRAAREEKRGRKGDEEKGDEDQR
jgi:hypothetical protein